MKFKFFACLLGACLGILPLVSNALTTSEAHELLKGAKTNKELQRRLDLRTDWPQKIEARRTTDINDPETFIEEARLDSLLDKSSMRQDNLVNKSKTADEIKRISKENGVDTKPIDEKSSIAAKGMNSLEDYLKRLLKPPKVSDPGFQPPSGIGDFLSFFMWLVIAAITVFLLFLIGKLVSSMSFKQTSEPINDAGLGIITDEEAAIPLDEWLEKGSRLIESGEYREALRCFYVAMLLRMGESNIVRLIRNETNWEHYERYQKSPQKLEEFGFLEETKEFDNVWYGKQECTQQQAVDFRAKYGVLLELIKNRR